MGWNIYSWGAQLSDNIGKICCVNVACELLYFERYTHVVPYPFTSIPSIVNVIAGKALCGIVSFCIHPKFIYYETGNFFGKVSKVERPSHMDILDAVYSVIISCRPSSSRNIRFEDSWEFRYLEGTFFFPPSP